jgi:hypothetical protein
MNGIPYKQKLRNENPNVEFQYQVSYPIDGRMLVIRSRYLRNAERKKPFTVLEIQSMGLDAATEILTLSNGKRKLYHRAQGTSTESYNFNRKKKERLEKRESDITQHFRQEFSPLRDIDTVMTLHPEWFREVFE